MVYKRMNDSLLARIERGEEVVASLQRLARAESIPGAALTGLGAVDDVTLALYSLADRAYKTIHLAEDLEIVSLTGNLAWAGADPVVHLHGVVSRADGSASAGHVMRAVVSVTLEVMARLYPERIERKPDAAVGLNLLDLPRRV